jgi:hypothetical protein
MGSDRWEPLRRLFRTVPELDRANKRSGATFVNILFGLVVTQAAIDLAEELVKFWDDGGEAIVETRLAHLSVAIVLTVLSWIGYHQSQQYPPFLIKFINIPFLQFVLDIAMVVTYYVVVAVAENSTTAEVLNDDAGTVLTHGAAPEAFLIFVVFGLYAMWDIAGYRLFRDPEYATRLETPRDPASETFGPRRRVTILYFFATGFLALAVWLWDPRSAGGVVLADTIIIVVLFLYRLTKQAVDPKMKTRSDLPPPTPAAALSA